MDAICKISWKTPHDDPKVQHVDLDKIACIHNPNWDSCECIVSIAIDIQLREAPVVFWTALCGHRDDKLTTMLREFHAEVYDPLLSAWQRRKKYVEERGLSC